MKRRLDHFSLPVADIDRSTRFYEQLGFARNADKPIDVDTQWIKEMTGVADAHLEVQTLNMGEAVLELLHYVTPTLPSHADAALTSPGSAHVAICVDDVASEFERLTAMGVKFRSKVLTIPQGLAFAGTSTVYGVDPDGYAFEILQWPG